MLLPTLAALAILGFLIFLGLWAYTLTRLDDGADLPSPQLYKVMDQSLAVYRIGEGPQLVLLHGLGASAYSWRYLIQELQEQYELIAIDLVGFGLSSRPEDADYSLETQSAWVHAAIQGLNLKPVALVGSSMGGLLALWLAKQFPDLYPRVVALAPAALGPRGRPAPKFWQHGQRVLPVFINRWTMPWIILGVVGSLHPLNRASLKRYLHPNAVRPFLLAHQSLCDSRLPGALAGMKAAVLLLWGRFDLLVSSRVMKDLRAVLPGAEWKMLNSAHHPHEQQPLRVAEEIREFLSMNTTRPASCATENQTGPTTAKA